MESPTDFGIAKLAARQHGVVSRQQLRAAGMGEGAIEHATRTGRLHRVFRGVYSLGHPSVSEMGRLRAATLTCGEGAVISHRSAGALLRLLDKGPAVIDVIAPGDRGRGIDGIRFHRVRPPRLEETGTVDGVPCTSPARTLVDLAGVVGDWTLRSAFERTAQRQMLDIPSIEASIDPGRRGIRSLTTLVDAWRRAAPLSKKGRLKSPLEAKLLPLLLQRNLPAPLLNAPVSDRQWPHRGRLPLARPSLRPGGRQPRLPRHPCRLRARSLARPGTDASGIHHAAGDSPAGGIRSERRR